ncbi:MAG: V-type ATP synthase subunit C [Firmicutes bacterium]|nr:V-type ATP synthase subunit C [Bacillota bacterium]
MNEQYGHAIGRVRSKERKLLDRAKIDRMAEARNTEEALKVLGETEYAHSLASFASVHDFDKVLDQELCRTYQEIRQLTPKLVSLFACKFDYHNLKVLFKSYHLGEKRGDLLVQGVGNIPVEDLARAVNEDNYSSLPLHMRRAARRVTEVFRLESDPQKADMLLEKAMYAQMAELVATFPSALLKNYFTSLVDLLNIKTFLRVKRANRAKEFLELALLPGGSLDITAVVQLMEPLEVLIDRLMHTPYARAVEEGVHSYQKTDTLTRFEKLADDFLLKVAKRAKYLMSGPEPVAGYLLAKENELKLLRIIMVGKINRLPTEEIKERLRDAYV